MGTLLRKGVRISLLMDEKQMRAPSCSKQWEKIEELMSAARGPKGGLCVKAIRPEYSRSGFSSMHVKSWCIDAEVYIGGSYNFTHNAEVANEEHLIVVRDLGTVATYKEWFHRLWQHEKVLEVSREILASWADAKEGGKPRRSLSRSLGRSDSAPAAGSNA